MKLRQIALVLALSWPVSGLADFAAGVKAYEAGDYAVALREFRLLAEQGDAGPSTTLATCTTMAGVSRRTTPKR